MNFKVPGHAKGWSKCLVRYLDIEGYLQTFCRNNQTKPLAEKPKTAVAKGFQLAEKPGKLGDIWGQPQKEAESLDHPPEVNNAEDCVSIKNNQRNNQI